MPSKITQKLLWLVFPDEICLISFPELYRSFTVADPDPQIRGREGEGWSKSPKKIFLALRPPPAPPLDSPLQQYCHDLAPLITHKCHCLHCFRVSHASLGRLQVSTKGYIMTASTLFSRCLTRCFALDPLKSSTISDFVTSVSCVPDT